MILPTGGCLGIKTEGIYAETASNTELFKSSVIPITARALPVQSSITYNHASSSAGFTTTASIRGTGTGFCTGGQTFVCTDYFARTYNNNGNGYSSVDVNPDTLFMPACKATVDYEIATDQASGLTVPYVASITVREMSKIFTNLIAVKCTDGECSTGEFWMPTCNPETGQCSWYTVWVPGFPGDGLTFLNNGGGAFDAYLWEYSNGYGSATLAVTVGLDI
jgi:hypothetical protein